MIEAKFFTVGTYLYKYNLTVLLVSPSKIAHEKFYIYCPPLLLNEICTHACVMCCVLSICSCTLLNNISQKKGGTKDTISYIEILQVFKIEHIGV